HLVVAESGHGGRGAVAELGVAGDADEAAPGARAEELAEAGLTAEGAEHVTAGGGDTVGEHARGALGGVRRPRPGATVAARPVVRHGAVEQLDEARGNLAAAVPAIVDDERGLVALAVELADEVALADDLRVGDVDVADLAVGLVFDVGAVG